MIKTIQAITIIIVLMLSTSVASMNMFDYSYALKSTGTSNPVTGSDKVCGLYCITIGL